MTGRQTMWSGFGKSVNTYFVPLQERIGTEKVLAPELHAIRPHPGQADGGLTCFLVPRVLPSGERNRLDVVRLKDKLGNRSNASSELVFEGTWAQRLGDEGRGVRTIIEMVAATRLDCVIGSSSLMRHALAEASWHVAHRSAFGSRLAEKPLMQNVIADLAVESEAATALTMRLAAAVDGLVELV